MPNKTYILYFLLIVLGFTLGKCQTENTIDFIVKKIGNKRATTIGSWKTNLKIARQDQPAMVRAGVARIGLGANTKEEAIYLTAEIDNKNTQLNSENDYAITFKKDIPVNAFWSMTAYGEDHFLIDNPYDKYAVSSFQDLTRNEDSTLTIILSKNPPIDTTNWIPLPERHQDITILFCCYNPKKEMLEDIQSVDFPIIEAIKL